MSRITISRKIKAPLTKVFDTVADINNFAQAISRIVRVEIISDVQSGIGCKFRETREMKGKEVTEELEVTEYVGNERIRIVCDSHGTVWDSLFTVISIDGETGLTLTMDANAHSAMARIMNPLIKGMVAKEVAKDMDEVKRYCEETSGSQT